MSTLDVTADAPRKRAIITPLVDAICVGGASIVVLAAIFLLRIPIENANWDHFLILAVLINQPHFMASYRLLYQSKEQVFEYRWASLYVPLVLIAYSFMTIVVYLENPDFGGYLFYGMDHVASVYLAWHYTGQSWGMTASFAYLGGVRFAPVERHLLKSVFRVLLVWHVVIYVYKRGVFQDDSYEIGKLIETSFLSMKLASFVAAGLGLAVLLFVLYRSRGKLPLRAILPLPALFLGYLLLSRTPAALFILQISHALQYLIFPMRVEMNRNQDDSSSRTFPIVHMLIYFALLVGAGWLVFDGPARLGFAVSQDERHVPIITLVAALIAGSVNIHHYFTDGCVWKISNPRVRKELFRHLKPPESA